MSVAAAPAGPAAGAGPLDHPAARVLIRRHRLRWWEALPWIVALGVYFIFPDYLSFGAELLIAILFALSLDLALGYAGIITLGHAAFFGTGAYTVGLLAFHGLWSEPITSLMLAGLAAAVIGLASGLVLLRTTGLTLLMLTICTMALLGRGRQHGARLYRRLRRVAEPSHCPGIRRLRVQSALRQHAISLRAGRALRLLRVRAHAWSIRRSARASPASAKMRCACMRSARRCGAGS